MSRAHPYRPPEKSAWHRFGGLFRIGLRYILFAWVIVICSAALPLYGQRIQRSVRIGDNQGNVRFEFAITYEGGEVRPDGSVLFRQPGQVIFTFRDFSVLNGFSSSQSDSLAAVFHVGHLRPSQPRIRISNQQSIDFVLLKVNNSRRLNDIPFEIRYGDRVLSEDVIRLNQSVVVGAPVEPAPAAPVNPAETLAVSTPPADSLLSPVPVKPQPPPKPIQSQSKSADQIAYEAYLEDRNPERGRAFLERYPDSEYVRAVLPYVPILQSTTKDGNYYIVALDYVSSDLRLDSLEAGVTLVSQKETTPFGLEYVFKVADHDGHAIRFTDPQKKPPAVPSIVISLENLLAGEVSLTAGGDSINFLLRGGVPPYTLLILEDNETRSLLTGINDTVWNHAVAELLDQEKLPSGTYHFELRDTRNSAIFDFEGVELSLTTEKNLFELPMWLWYVLGGVVVVLLISILQKSAENRRRKRLQKVTEQAEDNSLPEPPAEPEAIAKTQPEEESEPVNTPATPAEPAASAVFSRGGIRVSKRAPKPKEKQVFDPARYPEEYFRLDLQRHWRDTCVEGVFFSRTAIYELDRFLRDENTSKVVRRENNAFPDRETWEPNENIPEIGGMLVGQFQHVDNAQYHISIQRFVPIEASRSNVYQLVMDTVSLARELSNVQDEYPDLTVVGWFHTHPGHGLFLSQPDLKVHGGHFRQPYQVAMEIDSLTENLDTAFFSYRRDGSMNNQIDRRPGTPWFAWTDIEKFTRHK